MRPKRELHLHVLLTEDERRMLQELEADTGERTSTVTRRAVRELHERRFGGRRAPQGAHVGT